MMGYIRGGEYQMPLRPLEGTAPGHLFAEPVGHRRPFPKRRAVPYDRWRNRCAARHRARPVSAAVLCACSALLRHAFKPTRRLAFSVSLLCYLWPCHVRSGGKRGATIIQGARVSILRRYGNVVRHDAPPVRYVEYSVLAPTAASVANQPDGGAAAMAAARALGAGCSTAGSRQGGGVGRGGGGGGGMAPGVATGMDPPSGLEYRLYHTQHRECICGMKDCTGKCKVDGASPVASPSRTVHSIPASSSQPGLNLGGVVPAISGHGGRAAARKRKLSDMVGSKMSDSQSLMVDAALMSLMQPPS